LSFVVDLPIKNVVFHRYVSLPEGINQEIHCGNHDIMEYTGDILRDLNGISMGYWGYLMGYQWFSMIHNVHLPLWE